MQNQIRRNSGHSRLVRTAAAVFLAIAPVALAPSSVSGQIAEDKTAEQVYKNIVQLKGTPASQLMAAMQFISGSLGVDCTFCHVQGKMELDDKPTKKTARKMIAMTAALNKDSFGGRQTVTCYSCHHGAAHPVNVPPVLEADAAPNSSPAVPPTNGAAPAVDEIIEKYVAALGGAGAIRNVTSRVGRGIILANGAEIPIEVFTKAPNKRMTVSRQENIDSITAFDGTTGWMGSTGHQARSMTAAESAATGLDSEFYLPLRLKEIFPQLRRGRPEVIGGIECETLIGAAPGLPQVRLSFDKNSGLLVRMIRYAETPLGRNATQIDYSDYRDVGGAKTPFRWTLSRAIARFTIQLKEAQANVPLDDSKFAKPSGEIK